jgi:hypothetical protein
MLAKPSTITGYTGVKNMPGDGVPTEVLSMFPLLKTP